MLAVVPESREVLLSPVLVVPERGEVLLPPVLELVPELEVGLRSLELAVVPELEEELVSVLGHSVLPLAERVSVPEPLEVPGIVTEQPVERLP